jgi:hypothetical protein
VTVLMPGTRHVRPFRREGARPGPSADRSGSLLAGARFPSRGERVRILAVASAVCLDTAAALLLTTRHLPEAIAGVGLAGLGWFITGRLAAWHPRNTPDGVPLERSGTEWPR